MGRPLPKRAVGSTAAEGLEAEVAVILNAGALDTRNHYVAMTRGRSLYRVRSLSEIRACRYLQADDPMRKPLRAYPRKAAWPPRTLALPSSGDLSHDELQHEDTGLCTKDTPIVHGLCHRYRRK
jgi:DNA helicase-2/ATP-dependent DNA helicase PcrA